MGYNHKFFSFGGGGGAGLTPAQLTALQNEDIADTGHALSIDKKTVNVKRTDGSTIALPLPEFVDTDKSLSFQKQADQTAYVPTGGADGDSYAVFYTGSAPGDKLVEWWLRSSGAWAIQSVQYRGQDAPIALSAAHFNADHTDHGVAGSVSAQTLLSRFDAAPALRITGATPQAIIGKINIVDADATVTPPAVSAGRIYATMEPDGSNRREYVEVGGAWVEIAQPSGATTQTISGVQVKLGQWVGSVGISNGALTTVNTGMDWSKAEYFEVTVRDASNSKAHKTYRGDISAITSASGVALLVDRYDTQHMWIQNVNLASGTFQAQIINSANWVVTKVTLWGDVDWTGQVIEAPAPQQYLGVFNAHNQAGNTGFVFVRSGERGGTASLSNSDRIITLPDAHSQYVVTVTAEHYGAASGGTRIDLHVNGSKHGQSLFTQSDGGSSGGGSARSLIANAGQTIAAWRVGSTGGGNSSMSVKIEAL